jgi:hypothetical protein
MPRQIAKPAAIPAERLGNMGVLHHAVAELTGRRDQLVRGIEERKRRREDLAALPLPRSDWLDMLSEYADQRRTEWGQTLQRDFAESFPRTTAVPPHGLSLFVRQFGAGRGALDEKTLFAVFGPQLLAVLREEIKSWNWPEEVGPPRAARAVEIARLDAEISELETELSALRAEAAKAGVRL